MFWSPEPKCPVSNWFWTMPCPYWKRNINAWFQFCWWVLVTFQMTLWWKKNLRHFWHHKLCKCYYLTSFFKHVLQNVPTGPNNKPKLPIVIAQCGEMWSFLLFPFFCSNSFIVVTCMQWFIIFMSPKRETFNRDFFCVCAWFSDIIVIYNITML